MQIDNSLVISKVLILFLTMLCGIYARKRNIIDENGSKVLSKVLLNITNPLLIVSSFQMDFDADRLQNGLMILGASVLIHITVSFLAALLFKYEKEGKKNKILRFSLIFGNCAFLGYPVLDAIFGKGVGVFYGSFYTLMFNVYIWTYGVALLTRKDSAEASTEEPAVKTDKKQAIKRILLNPGTIGSFVGIVLFAAQIKLPAIVGGAVELVGDMTFPLSMLIVGSLVATLKPLEVLKNYNVFIFCAFKLLLLPVLMIFICRLFSFPSVIAYMLITMCGVPTASMSVMFSEIYNGDSRLAAQCIGLSTLFSMASLPFVIYLAGLVLN